MAELNKYTITIKDTEEGDGDLYYEFRGYARTVDQAVFSLFKFLKIFRVIEEGTPLIKTNEYVYNIQGYSGTIFIEVLEGWDE
jgi:hypothetical protein